jgi:transposase
MRGSPANHLVRGANTALDTVRRERQAGRRQPRGARRTGRLDTWNPALYRARHRLLKARERLSARDRRRLVGLFERELVLAEAWGLKGAFRVYDTRDHVEAECRPTTNGHAEGVINKVKIIERRAQGIPTFSTFRERGLLACG